MKNHHSLAARLNSIKQGDPIPDPPASYDSHLDRFNRDLDRKLSAQEIISTKNFLISEGYKLFNVLSVSILYGFGIKSLFSADWSFMGILGVGFLLNHSLTILLKLFKK